ncbi:type IV pilin [Haloferax sp. Atlit-12N]|uniref:type IV pilin n=1 Tax=Haloferax sp. Atlit-12N TaxID=2077203 RepID=UPI000E2432F8|nr:type IV pilin [Haloferax sp. Atlit-12N]RDZ65931.1 type IV pilin [Haloferax sp. Atlit-12N]
MSRQFRRSTRGSSVLLGSVLLIGLVVVVAAAVGAAAFDAADSSPTPTRPTALSLGVSGDTLSLTHEGGAPLDVESLAIRISVDGEPLAHQPPVPFFSASGFRPGPTGPFNAAADSRWTAGETATLELAGTNDPDIEPGAAVTVRVFDGETPVAALEAKAS